MEFYMYIFSMSLSKKKQNKNQKKNPKKNKYQHNISVLGIYLVFKIP